MLLLQERSSSVAVLRRTWLLQLIIVVAISIWIRQQEAANGEPIDLPDFSRCQLAVDHAAVGPPETLKLNCCLPAVPPSVQIHEFRFSDYGLSGGGEGGKVRRGNRIRTAAHRASPERIAQYNEAYARMKALPAEDPRSFAAQAALHCAFCNGAYLQKQQKPNPPSPSPSNNNHSMNSSSSSSGDGTEESEEEAPPLQIHFSWLFLPWHRWFLFFHERILASLVDDPSFSLVYWNWDDQAFGGNLIPPMFLRHDLPSLRDTRRNPAHDYLNHSSSIPSNYNNDSPQFIVRLNPLDNSTDALSVIRQNLNSMYKSLVTARTPQLFAGGAFRLGMDIENSTVVSAALAGSLEGGPHNGVHYWAGDPREELGQDMGTFSTAARDPLFYAHHSNIDRLWNVWRKLMPEGPREDHDDPDFLNSHFVFYDHRSRLVRVSVRDSLHLESLGYSYDDEHGSSSTSAMANLLWMHYKPPAMTKTSSTNDSSSLLRHCSSSDSDLLLLDSTCSILPTPPQYSDTNSSLLLEIRGLRLHVNGSNNAPSSSTFLLQLAVFVNLPDASAATATDTAEFVGAYTLLPRGVHGARNHHHFLTNLRFQIGDNLRLIGIQSQPRVVISIVVKRRQPSNLIATVRRLLLLPDQ